MKISDIRVDTFKVQVWTGMDKDGHTHPCKERTSTASILTILTDEGLTGEYLACTRPSPSAGYDSAVLPEYPSSKLEGGSLPRAIDRLKPVLVGEDPFCRERIFSKMFRMQRLGGALLNDGVVAMVDLALWDLAGKAGGLPVYRLLGGHRTRIRAYGSIMVGDDIKGGLDTSESYANFSKELIQRGYTAIKLHTWMDEKWGPSTATGKPDPERDIAACQAVREAVGQQIPLMLDAFHYYDRYEALHIGKELEKLNFAWIEEPMDEYSVSSYKWLCENLEIPVCGPETAMGKLQTRAEWIRSQACDIVRAGAFDIGGLTPLIKIVHLCEAFGMPIDLHGPGAGHLHMMSSMVIPGEFIERGLLHPFLDYDSTPPWLNTPHDVMDENGFMEVSDRPGFGFDINYDYIKDNLITE